MKEKLLKLNTLMLTVLLIGLAANVNATLLKISGNVRILAYPYCTVNCDDGTFPLGMDTTWEGVFNDQFDDVVARGNTDGQNQILRDGVTDWGATAEINFSSSLSNIPGFKPGQGAGSIKIYDFYPPDRRQVNFTYSGSEDLIEAFYFDDFVFYGSPESLSFIEYTDHTFIQMTNNDSIYITEVPEPATMLLFGIGLVGLAGIRLRRKK